MAVGSTLATVSGLGITLSAILGWFGAPWPWGVVLGVVLGLLAGTGATLAVTGMIGRRRAGIPGSIS
jgi:hypothetical protein